MINVQSDPVAAEVERGCLSPQTRSRGLSSCDVANRAGRSSVAEHPEQEHSHRSLARSGPGEEASRGETDVEAEHEEAATDEQGPTTDVLARDERGGNRDDQEDETA